jgi:class 3 adenylate cyclase
VAAEIPETRYARSGDLSIAYQVVGDGPFDLVLVPPLGSHVELVWELPLRAGLNHALASFSRLLLFDKRGTGLSDPVSRQASLEERMDDVRAVLDAVGSTQAAVFAIGDGCLTASLFASTHPERCFGLALFVPFARTRWAPDYPIGMTSDEAERSLHRIETQWGTQELADRMVATLIGGEPSDDLRRQFASFLRNSASPRAAAEQHRSVYDTDIRAVLPHIAVPTLVLAREEGGLLAESRDVAERIPGARLTSFPGNARAPWPNEEQGRRVVDAVEAFLQEAWQSRGAREPDRLLTTVLFTDIVDSTAKAVELGDTRWRELVAEHHRLVRRELTRFRGKELDTAGDGFFASFDGPARAIRCACAARDAVGELGLEIRAGLHTGECEQLDGKMTGIAVATGARIASLGGPGDVLVSATVRDLVAGAGLAFQDRGLHELKGLPEPRQVYAVV